MAQPLSASPPKPFDFTKRKRWADLLVTELSDGINLILSTSCTVLYCGPAVTELIGWRDTDLIDRNILQVITPDDHAVFRACFQESLQKDSEFLAYIRFMRREEPSTNPSTPRDVLFEVKGQPHVGEPQGKLFFATAKPYPSTNMSMLNTFLELKIENEQLRRRYVELQNCSPEPMSASALLDPSDPLGAGAANWSGSSDLSNSVGLDSRDDIHPSPSNDPDGSDREDHPKKKKFKKGSKLVEQYVCTKCGRTDSPEWRKGPKGPKTLCNACGLRWAKQVRRGDDGLGDAET